MQPFAAQERPHTAVDVIARALALEILRGERLPGTHLPPLRALALAFDVTLPTIQRVVAGLEAQGLVTARHGSGVVVHDPARHGELSLVPLWFEALPPDRSAALLDDLLGVRRVVAGHLAVTARDRVIAALPALGEVLSRLVGTSDLKGRVDLDLAFTRTLVEATGNVAARAVFRSIERLIREVPWVAEAFYADTADHDATLLAMAGALACDDVARAVEQALAPWDARAVGRYRNLVESWT